MVYGRYNELVDGVYKPTNITGGHHPVWGWRIFRHRENADSSPHIWIHLIDWWQTIRHNTYQHIMILLAKSGDGAI